MLHKTKHYYRQRALQVALALFFILAIAGAAYYSDARVKAAWCDDIQERSPAAWLAYCQE